MTEICFFKGFAVFEYIADNKFKRSYRIEQIIAIVIITVFYFYVGKIKRYLTHADAGKIIGLDIYLFEISVNYFVFGNISEFFVFGTG